MSFLNPWLLVALPLVALPVIIHLINQRRYQTVRWGAMMFLLAANRMSRGYARLRQWLILAARMLAIAGLILAISRPLASGLLGWNGGGGADATIVLLDRSPSMAEIGPGAIDSKLATARRQLSKSLGTLGATHLVVIESTLNKPRELASSEQLVVAVDLDTTDAASDLPEMLAAARQYVEINQPGRCDIWIGSDLRSSDWQPGSRRWESLRDAFSNSPQAIRFHLLAYAETSSRNLAVRVNRTRRVSTDDAAELLVSVVVTRESSTSDASIDVPLQFEVGSSRVQVTVPLAGDRFELTDHRIPLDRGQTRGWGRVMLPADANAADNEFYFVFDEPKPKHTIVVSESPTSVEPFLLAASISPEPDVDCTSELITRSQLATVDWQRVSLVIWHGPLPTEIESRDVTVFVNRGGCVLCLPPQAADPTEWFGVRWESWQDLAEPLRPTNWRGDQDLFVQTQSGAALPVGELVIRGYAQIQGDVTALASLGEQRLLLARANATASGAIYFCATLPEATASNLATQGVVLYAMTHRAIAIGNDASASTRQLVAGNVSPDVAARWQRIIGNDGALSTEGAFHRGVYQFEDQLLAVNRPVGEDQATVLGAPQVAELFSGLDFVRLDDRAGNMQSLVQEIWRLFLMVMIFAMIAEAALCLPKVAKPMRLS